MLRSNTAGLLYMRFIAAIAKVIVLASGLFATDVFADTAKYFTCPVPAGFEEGQSDLEKKIYSAMDLEIGSNDGGWYSGKIVTASIAYANSQPLRLPVADYPYFVGRLWGGPLYGGKLLSPMVCGFSISSYGWMVTVEWQDHGFASFDIRDALVDVPPPTKADVGATGDAAKSLPSHEFKFSIDGQAFTYVLSGITVAMNRVYRPDMMQDAQYKSTINDALIPELDSVSGVLLSTAAYGSRPEWSKPVAIDSVKSHRGRWFTDEPYTQPFDATATPSLLGRVMAVSSGGTKQPGQPADLDLHNNILTLTMPDGRTGRADVSAWASALLNSGTPGIPNPLIPIDVDGQAFLLVIGFASTLGDSNEMERLMGDLFAGEPTLVTDARQRATEPKRP